MVGAEKNDFDEVLPCFNAMGKNIVHCGGVGDGQAVKMCNQVSEICPSLPASVLQSCRTGENFTLRTGSFAARPWLSVIGVWVHITCCQL